MSPTLPETARTWAEDCYGKLQVKLAAECARVGDRIPYISEDGVYAEDKSVTDLYWWTNGFWPGMLWQMYHATGEDAYRDTARAVGAKLSTALQGYNGLHHDVGFMYLHSAVADYRLTGDEAAKTNGLHAANLLAGRYNPLGRFIRAWNNWGDGMDRTGWIIIDCMMNVPLLYWAGRELKDPRFAAVAEAHADTAVDKLVRPDGSCNHIGVLDPLTGELLEAPGGQGYEAGSSWTRGQAWAIYGMALSYRYTGKAAYLDAAKRVAHYFTACAAQTGYNVPVDFRAPAQPEWPDTTAAATAACGMLEIAEHVGEYERPLYADTAVKLLRTAEGRWANWDPGYDSILGGGSTSYHDGQLEVPIIYGDYFFAEGILRLLGKSFMIW